MRPVNLRILGTLYTTYVHMTVVLGMYFKMKTKYSKFSNIKSISFYNTKAERYFNQF